MKVLLAVSRVIDTVNEWMGRLTFWLVLLMVGVGAYNAIVRTVDREFGTRLSTNTLLEFQWYLFALVFLFAAAYILKMNQHIRVDVIYSRLSRRGQAWVDLLGSLLWLIPAVTALFILSIPLVEFSVRVREMSPDPGGLGELGRPFSQAGKAFRVVRETAPAQYPAIAVKGYCAVLGLVRVYAYNDH